MTRSLLVLALLFTLAAPSLGQNPSDYASKDGQFTVRFPGKPRETNQKVKSDLGELRVFVATYARADGSGFMASFTDFPGEGARAENRTRLYDGARDGMKGSDGKVISEKDIEVGPDKLPGREVELKMGKQRIRARFVLRDGRLYQVATLGSAEFVKSEQATSFTDSFQLTK